MSLRFAADKKRSAGFGLFNRGDSFFGESVPNDHKVGIGVFEQPGNFIR
jgi:hypothetical protein